MASDYDAIRRDHREHYGTKVRRWVKRLLVDRYDDRSHFVYELLQNAEDALGSRTAASLSSGVQFCLDEQSLRIRHYGRPFDERDVRSICAVAESTKDETAIGHFGVGFKSVFTITDFPEIHSGAEDFRIEDFVCPYPAGKVERDHDETVFVCPLRNRTDAAEVESGLRRLGADALRFLRHIDSVEWTVRGRSSGTYIRQDETLHHSHPNVRRATTLGEAHGEPATEQTYLVFSRPLSLDGGIERFVEIAFCLEDDRIVPVAHSPLVVFFPTVLETNLGFVIQGPYRTTLSRDNVLKKDPWNVRCVEETAALLVEALVWLRDRERLDVSALRSLPISAARFGGDNMFTPLFEETRNALLCRRLLPTSDGTFAAAPEIRIARADAVRQLFDGEQLARLLGSDRPLSWLTEEVTEARAADLREYLMNDLDVGEIRIEDLLPRLDSAFLEAQPPEWIRRLYELLHDLPSLFVRAKSLPLIRLSGTGRPRQVHPEVDGLPAAFLPGPIDTDFPTVHPEVCRTDASRTFLEALGLSIPDPVDDVLRHVLPKYRDDSVPGDTVYRDDFLRILDAFETDSMERRTRLVEALGSAYVVASRDARTGARVMRKPKAVYLPTRALMDLFSGVGSVVFVDDSHAALRGERARLLLKACGVPSYLRTRETPCDLTEEDLRRVRRAAGLDAGWGRRPPDRTLVGLEELLDHLTTLAPDERMERAAMLWKSLALLARSTSGSFTITYEWSYSHQHKSAQVPASFVRTLRKVAWVPDEKGDLRTPKEVDFDSLDWPADPFLQSKIEFRPPEIDRLAEAVGIDPEVLHLLGAHGIRTKEDFVAQLGLSREADGEAGEESTSRGTAALDDSSGDTSSTGILESSDNGADEYRDGVGTRQSRRDGGGSDRPERGAARDSGAAAGHRSPTPAGRGKRERFISYVAVEAQDEDAGESDGLDQGERMALEARAIALILELEPAWLRAPPGNRGFDLVQTEDGTPSGRPTRWCEVKAIRASLDEHPVGLSKAQFEFAAEHGDASWLYVVERADEEDARILRIRDPAGRAKTFTFDKGWRQVAQVEPED